MLSKFYSVLIGIVIALTLVGIVVGGVTRMREGRRVSVLQPVATNNDTVAPSAPETTKDTVNPAPTLTDADTGITIKGTVGADVKAPAIKPREIVISAKNFQFSPSEIKVKKDETVRITMKSTDGVHNLFIAGYDLRSEVASMNGSVSVSFTADKVGKFDMWCEVGSHKAMGMTGKLIVE